MTRQERDRAMSLTDVHAQEIQRMTVNDALNRAIEALSRDMLIHERAADHRANDSFLSESFRQKARDDQAAANVLRQQVTIGSAAEESADE